MTFESFKALSPGVQLEVLRDVSGTFKKVKKDFSISLPVDAENMVLDFYDGLTEQGYKNFFGAFAMHNNGNILADDIEIAAFVRACEICGIY